MLHSKLSIIEVLQIKGGLHGNKVNIHTKHYQLCIFGVPCNLLYDCDTS